MTNNILTVTHALENANRAQCIKALDWIASRDIHPNNVTELHRSRAAARQAAILRADTAPWTRPEPEPEPVVDPRLEGVHNFLLHFAHAEQPFDLEVLS